ncbi:hypothetical protein [Sphaerisporangium album]|uniref:hypothetical protein n=1 Tax=Sphaerisporangium album TaxID=509200 RepID=UPI0015F08563|nr:hypothetical protein [Sphaerisporangium album]
MPKIRGIRAVRVRWSADAPPLPLGCRWCGHAPYAHDSASLPHRRHHEWEQPTAAQMRARLSARRRLGLCATPYAAAPSRPLEVHPPAAAPRPGRLHERPVTAPHGRPVASPLPAGRGRAPDTAPSGNRRTPYWQGAAA